MKSSSKLVAIVSPNFIAYVDNFTPGSNSNLLAGNNRIFVPKETNGLDVSPIQVCYLQPSTNILALSYSLGGVFKVSSFAFLGRNVMLSNIPFSLSSTNQSWKIDVAKFATETDNRVIISGVPQGKSNHFVYSWDAVTGMIEYEAQISTTYMTTAQEPSYIRVHPNKKSLVLFSFTDKILLINVG